jgi:rhodanese-related sulfurtransferase
MKLRMVVATLVAFAGLANAEVININDAELVRLQASGVPVIDVRTADEWRETGVIKGAHLMTYSFSGGFDKSGWLRQLQQVAKPGQPVVLICRSGRRSAAVAEFLEAQPTKMKIYNATGGMNTWKSEGRPVVAP